MFYFAALFYSAGLGTGAATDAVLGAGFTLDQAINIALENSLKLKAKKAEWQSLAERLPQAEALPNPEVGIDTWNIPEDFRIGKTKTTIFWASQKFPYPGKLKLRGEVVSRATEAAKVRLEKAEIDLISDISRSYHELLYIDNLIPITQESKRLAERLMNVISARYSVGESNLNDVLKEQSHLDLLVENIALLADMREAENTRINSLLGMPPTSVVGRPEEIELFKPDIDADEVFRIALENRQELNIDSLEIEKNLKQLRLAEKERYPDFNVKLKRFQNYRSANGYGLFVGMSVPIWGGKNRARVNEARGRIEALTYKRQDDENRTYAEIKKTFYELNSSLRLINLYRKSLIPRAQESIEIAEAAYRTGKASFLDLFNAQNDLLNYSVNYRKLLRDHGFAVASLEQLVGKRLKTKGESHENVN